jgi:hypothetical protein
MAKDVHRMICDHCQEEKGEGHNLRVCVKNLQAKVRRLEVESNVLAARVQSLFVGVTQEVDVDGYVDKENNAITYIGKARKQANGTWRALANVDGSLCIVECRVTL